MYLQMYKTIEICLKHIHHEIKFTINIKCIKIYGYTAKLTEICFVIFLGEREIKYYSSEC